MKQTSHQNFEYEEYNVRDFDLKSLQRVRFWIENLLPGHFLIYKVYSVSDFRLKTLNRVRIRFETKRRIIFGNKKTSISRNSKKFAEKSHVCSFFPQKRHIRQISCFFKKNDLEINFHYMSEFELKRIQRVTFRNEKNKASDFDFKNSQRVRFCIGKKSTHQILN